MSEDNNTGNSSEKSSNVSDYINNTGDLVKGQVPEMKNPPPPPKKE